MNIEKTPSFELIESNPKVINATLNLATKMAKKSLGHDGWVYSKSFLNGISPIWKRDEKDTLADLSELDISVSSCIIQVSPMCAVTSGGIGGSQLWPTSCLV